MIADVYIATGMKCNWFMPSRVLPASNCCLEAVMKMVRRFHAQPGLPVLASRVLKEKSRNIIANQDIMDWKIPGNP